MFSSLATNHILPLTKGGNYLLRSPNDECLKRTGSVSDHRVLHSTFAHSSLIRHSEFGMSQFICVPLWITLLCWISVDAVRADELPKLTEIHVTSSIDGSRQPSLLWAPKAATSKPAVLFINLHSWSGDYRQKNLGWQKKAVSWGWIYLHPNFRGVNKRPEACGSKLARRDILDAIDYVIANYKVDESRVYLAGSSGGGHMTMLMASYYPERFSAASAWVGISDLAAWYRFHLKDTKPQTYARMVLASIGGAPGASKQVDAEYQARSPIFHLHNVGKLPIELCAGVNDGHTGSVPIAHTLRAFNVIAKAGSCATVSQREIDELSQQRRLSKPQTSDRGVDPTYGREIKLRRRAGPARVTIFDGGHEGIPHAAVAWLAKHRRQTCAAAAVERSGTLDKPRHNEGQGG